MVPYNDELGREYTAGEARFWRELRHAEMHTPYSIRPYEVAQSVGIDKQRMLQHLRTWDNDGLLVFTAGGNYTVTLTEYGRSFTFEERYRDIER